MLKLIGIVNGVEINFDFYPPNTFKAYLPRKINGKYILQLKVLDEAGNEDFYTEVYMFIDFNAMVYKVLPEKYVEGIRGNSLMCKKLNDHFDESVFDCNFSYKNLELQYTFKELIII